MTAQAKTVYNPSGVLVDSSMGDILTLDQYLSEVCVIRKATTIQGLVIVVRSTAPNAEAMYRLRATDDDEDRLLLEKEADTDALNDWKPHCRVEARLVEQIDEDD